MKKSNRYCVTGGTGFIGSHLVKWLDDNGFDGVSCVAHQPDLLDIKNCMEVVKDCQVVFHCAGVTAGAGVVRGDPMALVHDNLVLASNMLEASYRSGVKAFIFPSSTTGYPPVEHPVTEDEYHGELFEGYRTIGTVKRFIEDLACLYPMTTVALRISNVFGPGDEFDPVRSHVIQATIRKVAEHQNPIVVWGDGEEVRDALYVSDVVDSFIKAAEYVEDAEAAQVYCDEAFKSTKAGKVCLHDAFNIGMGRGYSIKEILAMLMASEGLQTEVQYDSTKPTLLKKRLVNVDKAKSVLGWEHKVSMEEALAKTLQWFKDHREGK